MPRPFCCRRIQEQPLSRFFKPQGIPLIRLEGVTMTLDEYEAVRLADLQGLYQEDAARRMGVSRQTFGRIVESAHRKIADALVNAKALEIKGGTVEMAGQRKFKCSDCTHSWEIPFGTGRPAACPQCQSRNIFRVSGERGQGRGSDGGSAGIGRGMRRRKCRRRASPRVSVKGGN